MSYFQKIINLLLSTSYIHRLMLFLKHISRQKFYTCSELIKTLKEMTVREILGEGYILCYTRVALTDDLHDTFGFRTNYNIITQAKMKEISR